MPLRTMSTVESSIRMAPPQCGWPKRQKRLWRCDRRYIRFGDAEGNAAEQVALEPPGRQRTWAEIFRKMGSRLRGGRQPYLLTSFAAAIPARRPMLVAVMRPEPER